MTPSPSSNVDPALQRKFEAMLKDPTVGPKLKAMLNGTTGQTPGSFMDALSQAGGAASQQTTPSGQLGAGLGSLGGFALGNLLKKKKPYVPVGPPALTPNEPDDLSGNSGGGDSGGFIDPSDMSSGDEDDGQRRGGLIRKKKKFAGGGDVEEEAPAAKRGVLTRRPILSTTIVIAPKKKPEKKKAGGRIKARKPAAVPPLHGPGNGAKPAAFAKGGSVPRGSGCAQRGKQFRGIY